MFETLTRSFIYKNNLSNINERINRVVQVSSSQKFYRYPCLRDSFSSYVVPEHTHRIIVRFRD